MEEFSQDLLYEFYFFVQKYMVTFLDSRNEFDGQNERQPQAFGA